MGSVGAALNKEALKSLNITHVLIVARSLNPAFPAEFNYKKMEGNSCPFFLDEFAKTARVFSYLLKA